jgi:hypothetical protein
LQAHVTVIVAESRHRNPALDNLKQKVTSMLKKWIAAAKRLTQYEGAWNLLER